MTAYPLGQNVEIVIGPVQIDGTLATPATLTLTVTLPDATTTAITINDLTNDSAGLYHLDYLPPQAGGYTWRAVATIPNFAQEGGFEVAAAGASNTGPVDLDEWKNWLNLVSNSGYGGDAELQSILNNATRAITFHVGKILPVTVAETCSGGQPEIVLANAVVTVASVLEVGAGRSARTITEQPLTSDASTWTAYGYTRIGAELIRRVNGCDGVWAPGRQNIAVAYTAGLQADDVQLAREAIMELGAHVFTTQQASRKAKLTEWAPQMAYNLPRRVVEKIQPIALGPRAR